jgi:hypothetical protein
VRGGFFGVVTIEAAWSEIISPNEYPAGLPFKKRAFVLFASNVIPLGIAMFVPNAKPVLEVGGCLVVFIVSITLIPLRGDEFRRLGQISTEKLRTWTLKTSQFASLCKLFVGHSMYAARTSSDHRPDLYSMHWLFLVLKKWSFARTWAATLRYFATLDVDR